MQYDIKDVLSHYGISFRDATGTIVPVLCPFHDDHNPSGRIDLVKGFYNCWSCNRHTTVLQFIAAKFGKSIRDVYHEVAKLDSTPSKYVAEDPANVEQWHVKLFETPILLEQLYKRCVSDEVIRQHRLGALLPGDEPPEIRIPIRNKRGEVIAIKSYRPGSDPKYFWRTGIKCNKKNTDKEHLLFPAEQLGYHKIVICGGEIKAIVAASFLNQYDIGAISGTGSESIDFTPNQLKEFTNKIVYVLYDVDETGVKSALKLCRCLWGHTKDIYLVTLPLDPEQFPHGDVNDFLAHGGSLIDLITTTPKWEHTVLELGGLEGDEGEVVETTLDKAILASTAKRKMKLKAVISSMDTSPYTIPKQVKLTCDHDHDYCAGCKVHEAFPTVEEKEVQLSAERIEIMEMVGKELVSQERVLKKAFGIPPNCRAITFEPQTFYHVEDVRISQHLDITSRTNERSMQAAYCIGENRLELNEGYSMIGRMYPHPSTQQATLLITSFEATQDALSTYSPSDLTALEIFSPSSWTLEGIESKLEEIYTDLSVNVTRIYGRQDLHLLYDLAYHSVLLLPDHLKGWVEVLVVGDSAQGKTLCADRLIEHYGLGERVVCKGATVAGLLGGLQQHGKRWFASWGKIPIHDRRLVVLDEVKGTSSEVIAGLTDMRSKGIAELTKIEKRRTNARTRLIMISNPRSERIVREYNNGIDVIRELIGHPEDVRRFDAIMIVAQKEVPDELIHFRNRPPVEHRYTGILCRELILFGWTIPNVQFEDETYIGEQTMQITKEFVEDVPIVDSGTMREKLLRLSTALAVRTFSISDPQTVYVRNCHADYILKYLRRLYSSSAFGYYDYSRKRLNADLLVDEQEIEMRILVKTPFPTEFVNALLMTDVLDTNFIQDILGWDATNARDLLAFFNRQHALKKISKGYRKTAAFTRLLLRLEDRCVTEGRPKYVREEF